ncbi:helix-turn-helix domain-containing protein [Haladaptatus sp. NG-WS-4]
MGGETIFAEVKIRNPSVCQVASTSELAGAVNGVSRTVLANGEGNITEELEVENAPSDVDLHADPVDEANGVFRLQRPAGQRCPCELIEQHNCPVRDIHANGGQLSLTFYAKNLRTVEQAVADIKATSDGVHLNRLYQSDGKTSQELVYIDRGLFTDRQREVLRAAHKMGYFGHPKEANAGEVAASLDIATTTFVEHLSKAQEKLLECLLGE